MSARIMQVFFTIDRSAIGLPPLTTAGHVVRVGRRTRVFNRYGQPVDMKVKSELFTVGKTMIDNVELRKAL